MGNDVVSSVEYENTPEDLAEFQEHVARNSRAFQRQLLIFRLLFVFIEQLASTIDVLRGSVGGRQ